MDGFAVAGKANEDMSVLYRADQIDSFLRPQELLAARANEPNLARLRALEDPLILRALAKQKELGFEIFTDGELRRRSFMSEFTDSLEGFDFGDEVPRAWDSSQGKPPVSVVHGIVSGKLRRTRPLTGNELPFMKQHSPGAIKVLLPSATQFPAIAFKRGVTVASADIRFSGAGGSEIVQGVSTVARVEFRD
jgi:5-methyltetrahydropteroyltriglutamate--homocysteine methyltransferase